MVSITKGERSYQFTVTGKKDGNSIVATLVIKNMKKPTFNNSLQLNTEVVMTLIYDTINPKHYLPCLLSKGFVQ